MPGRASVSARTGTGVALAGLAVAALAAVFTAAFVATVRLRMRWYVIAGLLAPAAVVRMLFAPVP